MDKKDAQKHIEELTREILRHNELYYNQAAPEIADSEYDALVHQLIELETQFLELRREDSPTRKVGAATSGGAIPHRVKMLSLDNTYSIQDIKAWHKRVVKGLGTEPSGFIVELKIDGVSASVQYKQGRFVSGATRGDGLIGEDITKTITTVKDLPARLKGEGLPQVLDVRAEVFMSRKDFEELNDRRKDENLEPFANPRNAAAGSLKLLDAQMAAKRHLKAFVHSFAALDGIEVTGQGEFLKTMKAFGLPVNPHIRLCLSIEEVLAYCLEFQEKRETLDYDVDGVVIKVDDFTEQKILGETMKAPRWAVAYKFPAQQATTHIEGIEVQVGRTGVLTPVAKLTPVVCAGVTISSATLHNFDQVKKLDIRVGDRVLIERAGDVIPKVVKVIERKDKKARCLHPPRQCPVCRGTVLKEAHDHVALRCINPSCPKQLERSLLHFSSRGAMDIDGFGEKIVAQLLSRGRLKDLADIYTLTRADFLNLDLVKDKKAENLIAAIEESKMRPLSRFLFGLGIPNIGEKAAQRLAKEFRHIDALMDVKAARVAALEDFGNIMADAVMTFFSERATRMLITRFKRFGVNMAEPIDINQGIYEGKTFVFTGEIPGIPRRQAQALVMRLGGTVASSVSQKTDFIVAGERPGSKLDKAHKLGIIILDSAQFQEMMHEHDI